MLAWRHRPWIRISKAPKRPAAHTDGARHAQLRRVAPLQKPAPSGSRSRLRARLYPPKPLRQAISQVAEPIRVSTGIDLAGSPHKDILNIFTGYLPCGGETACMPVAPIHSRSFHAQSPLDWHLSGSHHQIPRRRAHRRRGHHKAHRLSDPQRHPRSGDMRVAGRGEHAVAGRETRRGPHRAGSRRRPHPRAGQCFGNQHARRAALYRRRQQAGRSRLHGDAIGDLRRRRARGDAERARHGQPRSR